MSDPLVLLPGMMCDARLFGPQIEALSGRTALTLAPITRHDRIEAIAAAVLDESPARFALAGLSMGGIVAMEVMRQAAHRVTKLCLMDTNPLPETPATSAAREPQIIGAQSGRLEEIMRDEMKPSYIANEARRSEVMKLVMAMAQDLGPDVFVRQSRALQRRPDQQGTLRRITVPTLLMCGAEDVLCPVRRHELMAELIPSARLEVIPNAGHLPVLEQPDRVTTALRNWLDGPLVLT